MTVAATLNKPPSKQLASQSLRIQVQEEYLISQMRVCIAFHAFLGQTIRMAGPTGGVGLSLGDAIIG